MKRVVVFHLSYKGEENVGNRTHRRYYSIFKRKSAIVSDFFDWTKEEMSSVHEMCDEHCPIINMQIIGL